MKNKSVAILSPLCLCLLAGNAWADLEPFSFGASETLQHQSNYNHSDDALRVSDWISTTEFNAALNEALGRDKLVASGAVSLNRFQHSSDLDSTGYNAATEFDWNTVGDLSGALGADTSRRQYVYGLTSEPTPGSGAAATSERNLQTDHHLFARMALGGPGRWQIFGGADANQRRFSASDFRSQDERQWSSNLGTRYSTSPDLSFGLVGNYTRGEYPDIVFGSFGGVPITGASKFSTRSLDLTTQLQATGNSALDASVGYTSESSQSLSKGVHFVNGSLNWTWTPPSHFTVKLGLKRSSDLDTNSTGATTGVLNVNNLNGNSINNVALLDVGYALTAKVNMDLDASYSQLKYADLAQLQGASGSLRVASIRFTAHYLATRTTDLSCGGGYERRHVDAVLVSYLPNYTDTTVQCAASISFN